MQDIFGHTKRHPAYRELLKRHPDNPILKPTDWPYPVNSVFNPGAVRLQDTSETLLLVRVEDRSGLSHLTAARSADGVSDWKIETKPTLLADREKRPEEFWGVEDPRITWVPELNQYAVVYTGYSRSGPGVCLALTSDFRTFEHFGMIHPPDDKDAALLPCRFNGLWTMIHRPVPAHGAAHIWASVSPDLRHWGNRRILLPAREGGWWDASKIGLSPPPIQTKEGWLMFYHGVRTVASGSIYRVGLALLDLEDPLKVIHRSREWIFGPLETYEHFGDVHEVVFPCGTVLGDDGDTLNIYYGSADTTVCLATASINELLEYLKKHNYLGTA